MSNEPFAYLAGSDALRYLKFLMETGQRRVWIWWLWVVTFLGLWAWVLFDGDYLEAALGEWPMAAAMVLGSYFAGSTPMGGGVVGFPALVLLLDEPAAIGRDFSLAIQSVGMTSASILIFTMRRPLAKGFMRWAMVGSLIGTPTGCLLLAQRTPDLTVKLVFAVLLASFGLVQIRHLNLFATQEQVEAQKELQPSWLIPMVIGIVGGVLSSLTGVGIDTLTYVVLVLIAGAEVRAALYTSVVLMAFTSLVGVGTNLGLGVVEGRVGLAWLAAAPVVLFGAPIGVIAALLIPRRVTLWLVSLLCLGQFLWTGFHEELPVQTWALAIGCVAVGWGGFEWLVRVRSAAARSTS